LESNFFFVLIEFAGIAHLLIAMKAAGVQPSFEAAVVSYRKINVIIDGNSATFFFIFSSKNDPLPA